MFLSRLQLNPESRTMRRDLGNRHDLHRTVLSAFPDVAGDSPRSSHGVLFRLELDARRSRAVVLLQSLTEPSWTSLPDDYLVGPFDPRVDLKRLDAVLDRIAAGQRYTFKLLANPTVKRGTSLKSGHGNGERSNGQRVPVRDDGLDGWLLRKAEVSGVTMLGSRRQRMPDAIGFRSGRRLTFASVQFDGVLKVADANRMREAVSSGIGSAKAFGFGLLSIARAGAGR